jgi:hypothetical protein
MGKAERGLSDCGGGQVEKFSNPYKSRALGTIPTCLSSVELGVLLGE